MPIGPDTDRRGGERALRDIAGPQWKALMTFKGTPDDLGDLVDPQDDTYGEEGTHGLPLLGLAAGAAMGAISKLTSDGGK